jgi:hypothetical protein
MTQEHRTVRALPPLPRDEWEDGAKSTGWDIEALRTHLPAREAVKLRRGN